MWSRIVAALRQATHEAAEAAAFLVPIRGSVQALNAQETCSIASFTPGAVPGPSMLYGALQCLQYSQSRLFLRPITDFQIAQDNALQPLQVPRNQDPKPAKVRDAEQGDPDQGHSGSPWGCDRRSHLRTKAGRALAYTRRSARRCSASMCVRTSCSTSSQAAVGLGSFCCRRARSRMGSRSSKHSSTAWFGVRWEIWVILLVFSPKHQ